jgi:hypothetical protein
LDKQLFIIDLLHLLQEGIQPHPFSLKLPCVSAAAALPVPAIALNDSIAQKRFRSAIL